MQAMIIVFFQFWYPMKPFRKISISNPLLTLGTFCQKHIFWTFWNISAWMSHYYFSFNLLKKSFTTWQHVFLSMPLVSRFTSCLLVQKSKFWGSYRTRKWPYNVSHSITHPLITKPKLFLFLQKILKNRKG